LDGLDVLKFRGGLDYTVRGAPAFEPKISNRGGTEIEGDLSHV
jgi:hypothetical protein